MGVVAGLDADNFPPQGAYFGKTVRVCFNYDTNRTLDGVVVRDDASAPGVMIICLSNGRYILASECQWQPKD